MSTISLRLPDSLHAEIKKLAEQENVSINHLATLAIAEKIAALETEVYLRTRAERGNRERFLDALSKGGDEAPRPDDLL